MVNRSFRRPIRNDRPYTVVYEPGPVRRFFGGVFKVFATICDVLGGIFI